MELLLALLDIDCRVGEMVKLYPVALPPMSPYFTTSDLQLCQSCLKYWASFDVPARKCRVTECEEKGSTASLSSVHPLAAGRNLRLRGGGGGLACLYKWQIKPKLRSFDPDLVPASPSPGKEQEPDLP